MRKGHCDTLLKKHEEPHHIPKNLTLIYKAEITTIKITKGF